MKFTWRDKLTVIVSEMSRATALDCSRDIDEIDISADSVTVTRALETLIVHYAPVTVIVDGRKFTSGAVKVEYAEDEWVEFTLPLDSAGLDSLPRGLADTWTECAVNENQWLVDALKNVLSRVTQSNPESQPGNESPLNSRPTSEATKMIG